MKVINGNRTKPSHSKLTRWTKAFPSNLLSGKTLPSNLQAGQKLSLQNYRGVVVVQGKAHDSETEVMSLNHIGGEILFGYTSTWHDYRYASSTHRY